MDLGGVGRASAARRPSARRAGASLRAARGAWCARAAAAHGRAGTRRKLPGGRAPARRARPRAARARAGARPGRQPSQGRMSAQRLEAFLALLYTDAAARRAFLTDPHGMAAGAGLDRPEVAALAAIDRVGLELAARSFAAKRAAQER